MSQYDVPVLWSPDTRLHDPRHEVWVGVQTVGTETSARVDAILDALDGPGFRLVEVVPAEERPALDAVHDPALVEFLGTEGAGEYGVVGALAVSQASVEVRRSGRGFQTARANRQVGQRSRGFDHVDLAGDQPEAAAHVKWVCTTPPASGRWR